MLLRKSLLLSLLALPVCATLFCHSKENTTNTEPAGAVALRDSVIAEHLDFPWEILWGPDSHIWFTQRSGAISRLNPADGSITSLITIADVTTNNEGGLLGMVLHPDFSAHPQVFVVYDYRNGADYLEKLVRYTYDGHTLTGPVILLDNIPAAANHDGCRLLIAGDKLFMTTGDATDQSLPQNTASVNGKVLRLNLDGSIPSDNPVAGNPYWSYGHRNAQGLVFANNRLYISEHGPDEDDEINIIEKGRNYGWPDVHGYCDKPGEQDFCRQHGVVEPIKNWTPTIAPSGLDYYNSNLIPQWKNSLLMATLKDATLYQLKLGNDFRSITAVNKYFTQKYGRIRDICISPAGKVYLCTSNGGNDKIVEIGRKE